jgi:hypothetical protein
MELMAIQLFAESERQFSPHFRRKSSTALALGRLGVLALSVACCVLVWVALLWLAWVLFIEDPLW